MLYNCEQITNERYDCAIILHRQQTNQTTNDMDKRNKHEVAQLNSESIGNAEYDSALESETGNKENPTVSTAAADGTEERVSQTVEQECEVEQSLSSKSDNTETDQDRSVNSMEKDDKDSEETKATEETSSGEESAGNEINSESDDVIRATAEILNERKALLAKYFDEIEILQKEKEEALSMLHQIFEDDVSGEKGEAVLSKLVKAVTFDREVAAARHAGEIAGRNAKIEMEMLQEDDGDGLPHIESRKVALREEGNHNTIFDLAGYAR